jgi:hypothetical protein
MRLGVKRLQRELPRAPRICIGRSPGLLPFEIFVQDRSVQVTAIRRGLASSALGSTKVKTPSLTSALILPWSTLLLSAKLR